jgi:hypothetical protein
VLILYGQIGFSKQVTRSDRASAKSDGSVTFPVQRTKPNRCRFHCHENRHLISERSIANMKTTNSLRLRVSRFFSDRYAYRERPDYLIELVAFGIIVIIATLSLANAMATALK